MKFSLGNVFRTGDFWSNLEATIKALKKRIKQNSDHISDINKKNNMLLEHIKYLSKENQELKERLSKIEDRVWDLNVVNNSENLLIVKDIESSDLDGKNPNKALQRTSR